ncbi:hypothetical protein H2200_010052 [Cladophialophora chaetospira]|uniref:D-xylulose reductase n=1 Tax=Cladophialophora chaetospira TaxID=386627 RepID=A0AA38X288_9EURO|nr:hypothetical protein H2200_010052 [Cladophialophora chaetospira]
MATTVETETLLEHKESEDRSTTKKQSNPSFVLQAPNKTEFEDRAIPRLEDSRSVLVQVQYTGICGSDVHYWLHGRIADFVVTKPMVLGHESSGTVVEVGAQVKTLKTGDRVALEPGIPCRYCDRCKEGKYNLCSAMAFAATPPYDGTLAKYYVLPEDLCYKLPDHVSLEEGALLEPLSVAVHIVRQSNMKHGDTVIVFGAGPIGLLCCAVVKAFGASRVVAVDIQQSRLDFAVQFANTAAFIPDAASSAQDNASRLLQDNGLDSGADIVIDASGAEPSIQTGIHALRTGGTYVQGGIGRPEITFPIMSACTRELTLKGSFRYGPGDYEFGLSLIATGKIDVKKLISKTFAFEDAEQAFHTVKAGKGIKTLIAGPP